MRLVVAFLEPQIPQSLPCTQELGASPSSRAGLCSHCCISFGKTAGLDSSEATAGVQSQAIATTQQSDIITVVGNVVSSVEMRQRVILCEFPVPQGKHFQNGGSGSLTVSYLRADPWVI